MTGKYIIMLLFFMLFLFGMVVTGDFTETWQNGANL